MNSRSSKAAPCAMLIAALFIGGCKSKPNPPGERPSSTTQASPAPQPETAAQPAASQEQRPSGPIRFTDITAQAGIHFVRQAKVGAALREPVVGRGAAYGDIDDNGDLDLVLTTSNGPARLLRNDGANQNDMLRVKLVGTRSNRDGIGARVLLTTSTSRRMSAMVKSGSSYLSQSELPLTFGLGKPDPAKRIRLEVEWPGQRKQTVSDIQPDQFITVKEGAGVVSAVPIHFTDGKK